MLDRVAFAAIGSYQRHLSPRKGYACAYRIANGGTGCSGFAKHAIAEKGVLRAIPLIRARFSACSDAAKELQEDQARRKKDKWYDNACVHSGCDCSGCVSPARGCGKADTTPDCSCLPDGCGF